MWEKICDKFEAYPQRLVVAQEIVRHGLRIEAPGVVKCGDIGISLTAIGEAVGVDRRTVRSLTEDVCADEELCEFFSRLQPAGPSLENVCEVFGYGFVKIYVESPENPGILSEVTATIAGYGVAIRQVLAEDVAIYQKPCLKVITQEPLRGAIIETLSNIKGVTRVIIEN